MLIKIQDIQQVANEVMNMLHEEEIEVINDFHDAVVAKDIEKIDELFKVVLFDVEDHFQEEENMMLQNNYGYYQVHKSDHDTMREKLAKYFERWLAIKSPIELQGFLENEFKKWLILHISKWDTEAALHLGHAH
ncbi:bacteriohemerythrin [Sulfurimonas aquatica]|uniref:Bacteriohemerythrin n=1 Tax=Sulfurimonas aquatica TaxID=2672570 RepID=A0A975AYA4_9BACT|nr:hemerythrin family protein [Sulfurimonas aquatica]QSZ40768.1 bacteriohemerythrin [Sulfurimonas aquatica]